MFDCTSRRLDNNKLDELKNGTFDDLSALIRL